MHPLVILWVISRRENGFRILMNLEIVNLVANGDIKQPVDLLRLSELRGVDFNKDSYGGKVAYLKTEIMFRKVSIFSSGKLISVGFKNQDEARTCVTSGPTLYHTLQI
jgi:TATA-box binding protein (TBP) (component of TFIID and TFIIIB)